MNAVMNQASHWMGIGAVELHVWFVYTLVLSNLAATDRYAFLLSGLNRHLVRGIRRFEIFGEQFLKVFFNDLKLLIL